MSKVIRSVKNVTKGYSAAQVKVRDGGSFLALFLLSLLPPSFSHPLRFSRCGDDAMSSLALCASNWLAGRQPHITTSFGDMAWLTLTLLIDYSDK